MKGRPLTREEERRMAAEASGHSVDSGGLRRDAILPPMEQITTLFVLGMLAGITAVFFAVFVL
jgi:hypothetical protein